jgi:hypothetical protein
VEPKPRDPWDVELPKGVRETLDKLLSGDAIRLLFERTGGLLDQLTGGAYGDDAAQPDDDEHGDDYEHGDDEQGDDDGQGSSGSCQGTGQASTWWSGSARSGCS